MNELPRAPVPEAPRTNQAAPSRRRRRWPWLLLMVLLAGGGWFAWRQGWLPFLPAPQGAAAPPSGFGPSGGPRGRGGVAVPVTAAAASIEDVPILLDALGTVQAYNTITVVPQVAGRITEIAFTEGQDVTAGEVLVRLDARTYQAALDQAVATKAQREAQLANARVDLQRYTQLVRSNGASQQTLDTQRAQVAQLEAQVQFDQATIDNARAQLDYTVIRAPVDGRVGLRQVDVGNVVQASAGGGIVTVTQVRPISVTFTLPQQALPQVMAAIAEGPVQVEARLPPPVIRPRRGRGAAAQSARRAGHGGQPGGPGDRHHPAEGDLPEPGPAPVAGGLRECAHAGRGAARRHHNSAGGGAAWPGWPLCLRGAGERARAAAPADARRDRGHAGRGAARAGGG